MSIFDKYSLLDPAKMLREIETAHGSAIFDNMSILDPQRARYQMEGAFGVVINPAAMLDPSRLETLVDAAIEADSSPEWVPDNAKIFIDLVNDRAWTEADGEVAIDTLLGADANTNNGWGETGYSAADLTVDGLVYSSSPPALIGSALTRAIAGMTLTVRYKFGTVNQGGFNYYIVSADGSNAVYFEARGGTAHAIDVGSYTNGTALTQNDVVNSGGAGHNVAAITATSTRGEFATNGFSVQATTFDNTDWPSGQLVAALIEVGGGALQSITIYDALPSTAGLSALSETGVTNTAPTVISMTWFENVAPEGVVVSELVVPAALGILTATDPQGNPCAFEIISVTGSTAEFSLEPTAPIYLNLNVNPADGGEAVVTIRATDPGGLYVEQEFTITVTA